jgi:hypothetical protein
MKTFSEIDELQHDNNYGKASKGKKNDILEN